MVDNGCQLFHVEINFPIFSFTFPMNPPVVNFWPFWDSAQQFGISFIVPEVSGLPVPGFISYGSIFTNLLLKNSHWLPSEVGMFSAAD